MSLHLSAAYAQATRRPSQSQVGTTFLRAMLRSDCAGAYALLAPEVRRAVQLERFEAAALPLWRAGHQHSPQIELYKLGMRLSETGGSRLFYSYSFVADSNSKTPSVLLEVTFRDTAARSILGFSLRPTGTARPVAPTGKALRQIQK